MWALRHSQLIQSWIQTLGILIGSGWGVYTFIYKDILIPSWQPANLSVEATIKPEEGRSPGPDGMEAMLTAKATNTSTRTIYLLANYWFLITANRQFKEGLKDEQHLINSGNKVLRQSQLSHVERHVTSEAEPKLLAIGRLFDDDVIQPGESINRTILIRIPPNTDAVELRALLPLLTRRPDERLLNGRKLFNGLHLEWGLADPLNPSPMLCSPPTEKTRNNNCQWKDIAEISDGLNAFDRRNFILTIYQQIGLPDGEHAAHTPPRP